MLQIIALTLTLSLLFTKSAYAYIDPATGTLIVQLLIAAFATAIATIKLWWYKVKLFFKGEKSGIDTPAEPEKTDTEL